MNPSSEQPLEHGDAGAPIESGVAPINSGAESPADIVLATPVCSVEQPSNVVTPPPVDPPRHQPTIPTGWHSTVAAVSDNVDLMKPLPDVKPGVFDRIQVGDISEHLNDLRENGLLIVSCLHASVVADAAWWIAKQPRFKGHEKWLYEEPSDQSEQRESLELAELIAWHQRHPASIDKLSFVHVTSRRWWNLLANSLKRDAFRRYSTSLKQARANLVLLVHPDALPFENTDVSVPGVSAWKIEFLLPLLYERQRPNCASQPEDVYESFKLQLERWPSSERELYDDVIHFLGDSATGYQRFEAELRDRLQPQRAAGVSVPDLFAQSELHRAVLLTATFFPESSPQAIDCVLNVLLVGIRHTLNESRQVINSDGRLESRLVTTDVEALDYWRRQQDRVISECGLSWQLNAQGQRVLDFRDPRVRPRLESLFRETHAGFVLQQFQRLYASGLLFATEDKTPRTVAEHLIRIAGTVAAENRGSFGTGWLLDAVRAIETWYPEMRLTENEADGVSHDVRMIGKFLEFIAEKQGRTIFFYHRLSDLCAELLRREATRPTVTVFLRLLLDVGDAASGILLRLVRRLKWVEGFDYFDWLRQVLDHAPLTVRIDVEQQLLRDAFAQPGGFDEVGTRLSSWHPPLDQTESKTMSGQYALGFLLDFFVFSRNQFDAQFCAQPITARHPVFSGTEADRKSIDVLVPWMLHPALGHGLRRVVREFAGVEEDEEFLCDPAWVISEVIDEWTRMADQLGSEPLRTSCEQLVEALRQRADRRLKSDIQSIWRTRLDACRAELATIGNSDRELRRRLQQTRDRLMRLRQRLSVGNTESPGSEQV